MFQCGFSEKRKRMAFRKPDGIYSFKLCDRDERASQDINDVADHDVF